MVMFPPCLDKPVMKFFIFHVFPPYDMKNSNFSIITQVIVEKLPLKIKSAVYPKSFLSIWEKIKDFSLPDDTEKS